MTRKISWIVLTLVGTLTLLGALASASVAHWAPDREAFASHKLADVASGKEGLAESLRARRGTAAAYAAAFGTLFVMIAAGPYRRGDTWSWWALLVSLIVLSGLTLLRIPFIGTHAGAGTAGVQLGVGLVALLLDHRRLRGPAGG